jgi:glycosyltransferase involved in cell wall biosynthesis
MSGLPGRALKYYRKHGFQKSMRMLARKLAGTPPQPAPPPPVDYSEAFGRTLSSRRLGLHPKRAPSLFVFGKTAIIGELNIPQCKKYRVLQKLEILDELGIGSNYSYWNDVPRSLNLMQTASAAIIYRVPANETFWSYLKEATRLGMSIGYDIDDPIFDSELYNRNRNLDFLSLEEKRRLVSDSDGYLKAVRACDFLITSTPGMVDLACRYYKGPIYLWRNAVDKETLHSAGCAVSARPARSENTVTIAYISGSRAHEADFREVESALYAAMKRHRSLRLLVIGHLNIPEALRTFADRIECQQFSSYDQCLTKLARADINIVPLLNDPFNNCKSAIRYLDAASVSVPTIASAVGDFVNVISDETNGLLARDRDEWDAHLDFLVQSKTGREAMGKAACAMVLRGYTTHSVGMDLNPALIATLKPDGCPRREGA